MRRDVAALAVGFAASGVLHLVKPEPYVAIVPKPLPFKEELVAGSGVLEIILGAMMLYPRTRKLGGKGSVALLAAVFPANVQMAIDVVRDEKAAGWFKAGTVLRLPLQAPMIRVARKAARG
ncbi:membrane protein [Aeromicrobium panaciterrae]|uniref:DoxX family protein n=1 Tax=Aeromicrobium panaciterrae TaxID=363861 RepID=UPI0031DDDBFB